MHMVQSAVRDAVALLEKSEKSLTGPEKVRAALVAAAAKLMKAVA